MAEYTYNPSSWETEAGVLQVQSQLGLHSKFQTGMGYIARLSEKHINKQKYIDAK
jgi:hypothetical protein